MIAKLARSRSSARVNACDLIAYYLDHHDAVQWSFEKNCYYEWAIKEALITIKCSDDTPIEVLDRMLAKFDSWAHCESAASERFAVAASAIDDIIDLLLTS